MEGLRHHDALEHGFARPDHFGHGFDLHLADGTPAHSACIGFGLDRITLALFAVHGMRVEAWPEEVRSALSL